MTEQLEKTYTIYEDFKQQAATLCLSIPDVWKVLEASGIPTSNKYPLPESNSVSLFRAVVKAIVLRSALCIYSTVVLVVKKMSLIPFLLDYELERPRRLMDQHFGLALTPEDLLSVAAGPLVNREYYRPWRHLAAAARDLGSSIKADKDKFQVNLDVQHFAPEEISVKTADGYIVVEGKHEEKKDQHGYISRQFTRRYALPEGCAPETVESRLSSDGVLTVTAPRKVPPQVQGERKVPIAQTGPVRKEVKDQANGDKAEN